jgi:hypothetical protein
MKCLIAAFGLAFLVGGCAIQVPTSEIPMLNLAADHEAPKK